MYAWETALVAQIQEIRRLEVDLIRRSSLIRLVSEVLNISLPFLVGVFTFALFTLSDPVNHQLTPQIAFVSLTLFMMLRMPLILLADLISQSILVLVSNQRLKAFFMAEEVDPEAINRDLDPDYERAIDVEMASFDWDSTRRAFLTFNDSFQIANISLK